MPESHPATELFVTADGSPTLTLSRADGYREKMHHSGGALTESIFVYGEALERALDWTPRLRVISVGLGLAYNELITLARAAEHIETLWSFETVSPLRAQFRAWCEGRQDEQAGCEVIDRVAGLVATHFGLSREALRGRAQEALASGRLRLRGAFPEDLGEAHAINLIYFDAFSNKMDPDLWSEGTLTGAFASRLEARAVLATYAATGTLNRALKALGFKREKKRGFMGRRQSTLAVRDVLATDPAPVSDDPKA